ncbi:hypothetical protein FVEN_g4053 [Fusarium venenatum]|uniref:Uncharacterized protein n=1 Tax=Fusarium venenatum TaxID=56646 RepID=A0A2L2TSH2_9HYPO|nr:uncharacterized protein FVRRES_09268 [Fusarium venenatum]KAG8358096.1 hypothetical protein FVEN_g4053 [Fusarium venenatum]KAH6965958.1 hypothetical protein EDB82DRAFT_541094 [Fusarium venenatum]CEI69191.1 unnamed protein product [Fusarium venenatum]
MDSFSENDIQDYPEALAPLPIERSAEMPMLWDEEHIRLTDFCARSESLYETYLQLPVVAAALENNQTLKDNNVSVADTVAALTRADWSMLELLHSMDLEVVQSIVNNTFAYDVVQRNITCFPMPRRATDVIPGVHVIGLSLEQYCGQFLNTKEIERLFEQMKEYVAGYKANVKYQSAPTTLSKDEKLARHHVNRVDKHAAGEFVKDIPAFITRGEDIPSIEALIKTFEKMCDRSLDSTGLTRMLQSPLYVDCSTNLYNSVAVYGEDNVRNITRPLGHTVSILRKLGHKAELTIGNVVRVWKSDQLPKAEQLVTNLAGSLVYQHEFNAIEEGATSHGTITDDEGLRTNTAYLFSGIRIFDSNLRDSLEEAALCERYLKDMNRVNAHLIEIIDFLDECTKELESLPPDFQWNETLSEFEKLIQKLNKDVEDMEGALKFWKLILDIQNIVIKETGRALPLGLGSD